MVGSAFVRRHGWGIKVASTGLHIAMRLDFFSSPRRRGMVVTRQSPVSSWSVPDPHSIIMIATAEQGTKAPNSTRHNAEGQALGPHASEKVLGGGLFMAEMASRTPRRREVHHLVHSTFGSCSGKVVPVPNLDKRSVGGLPKRYHQTRNHHGYQSGGSGLATNSTRMIKDVHHDDNRRQDGRLGSYEVRIVLSISRGDQITLRKAVKNTIAA